MKKIRTILKRIQKKVELRRKLASFVSFIKQKEILIGISALLTVVVIVFVVIMSTTNKPAGEVIQDIFEQEVIRHPLTGQIIDAQLDNLPQVFGVMVENSADAWPLSGLDQAFLVIEAPVEGSIPRFIAFFSDDQEVEKIGPVRSARPYYIDWNDGLQAMYTHVGGSPEALELIKNTYDTLLISFTDKTVLDTRHIMFTQLSSCSKKHLTRFLMMLKFQAMTFGSSLMISLLRLSHQFQSIGATV